MRQIDDKIVYAINQSIPTASFKGQSDAKENCKGLHETVSFEVWDFHLVNYIQSVKYITYYVYLITFVDQSDLWRQGCIRHQVYSVYSRPSWKYESIGR